MAWIESHQSLERHPKTHKLAALMGWSLDETLGKLHRLWYWALDYAEDGNLEKYERGVIAGVMGVPHEHASQLIDALIASKFADTQPYRIHDWWNYVGAFLMAKYKHNSRKYKAIRKLYKNGSNNRSKNGSKNGSLNSIPNLTLPNQKNSSALRADEFDTFWMTYPRKKDKGHARRTWEALSLNGLPSLSEILAAVERDKLSEQWRTPKFIPYPATWLRGEQWSNEPEAVAVLGPQPCSKCRYDHEPPLGKDCRRLVM